MSRATALPALRAVFALFALCLATVAGPSAHAEPADIAAVSRSVVRIVLVAEDGERSYYVGHGSGVAVSPTEIITNAHLVDMVREDDSVVIGIIPSQGSQSFGGRLTAYSPGNDLALITLESGRLPPATFFAEPPRDALDVIAIGYPAAVDRAQGLQLSSVVAPMAPVKTPGVVSGGRTSREFDTVLHTAALASGNSGGPLVDECGRVVGINSFGSLSDGNDAEYGFAVSNREIFGFLRDANIQFRRTDAPCRSSAEISEQERERNRIEMEQAAARQRAANEAQWRAEGVAQSRAERAIIDERENHMAVAALLLALAVLAAGGGALMVERGSRKQAMMGIGGGVVLMLGAALTFLLRPGFDEVEARAAEFLAETQPEVAASDVALIGSLACTLLPERSRVTVSEIETVSLNWGTSGCVNGAVQYGENGSGWQRIFVPADEQTVSVNRFSPERGEFVIERYLLPIDTMERARALRSGYSDDQCTSDDLMLAQIQNGQAGLLQALPGQPNERLVFSCALADTAE